MVGRENKVLIFFSLAHFVILVSFGSVYHQWYIS